MDDLKIAGALLFVGGVQFVLGMIVAEALYSGYSISGNYISDLGVGPSAFVFNSSVFVFGLMMMIGAFFIQRGLKRAMITTLFVLVAVGAMGVGVFTEHVQSIHTVAALMAFLFGGLSAIAAHRISRPPMRYFCVATGTLGLLSLVFFGFQEFLGLGHGGMERMITYPVVLWSIGFGGYLMALQERTTLEKVEQL